MNHVPDEALDAIDAFGEGVLRSEPPPVRERLRSDLRLRITADDGARTATCRFETEHTTAPESLRGRGSYVRTIVDGIDAHLETWGIEPPPAYRYTGSVEGTHRYEGTLRIV